MHGDAPRARTAQLQNTSVHEIPCTSARVARPGSAGRERRLGGHAGTAQRRRPRPRPRGGAAASNRPTAAIAGRQPRCGHRVQLRSSLRPRPLPDPGCWRPAASCSSTPAPAAERADDLGPLLPGFTGHEQHLHSEAAFRDTVQRTGGLSMVAAQTFRHPRSATAEGLQAQAEGATTRHSPCTRRRSCAQPSRRSWPACPAPRSPGLTNTSWSSSAGATTTRLGPTVWQPGEPGDQGSGLQISPERAGETPRRRPGGRADHPVMRPVDCW